MKNSILIFACLILVLSSCEGIKSIQIHNFSQNYVELKTSHNTIYTLPDLLKDYPGLKLKPSDSLTLEQRINFYRNLFNTENEILEKDNNVIISMKPYSSVTLGAKMWVLFPSKIKPEDIYIDTLIICLPEDTIRAETSERIIELARDKRFRINSSDKDSILLHGRLFKNIVIR